MVDAFFLVSFVGVGLEWVSLLMFVLVGCGKKLTPLLRGAKSVSDKQFNDIVIGKTTKQEVFERIGNSGWIKNDSDKKYIHGRSKEDSESKTKLSGKPTTVRYVSGAMISYRTAMQYIPIVMFFARHDEKMFLENSTPTKTD